MCFGGDSGGGGDGGAEEMRAQEERRKAEIAASIKAVNDVFDGSPARKYGTNPTSNLTSGGKYYNLDGSEVTYRDPVEESLTPEERFATTRDPNKKYYKDPVSGEVKEATFVPDADSPTWETPFNADGERVPLLDDDQYFQPLVGAVNLKQEEAKRSKAPKPTLYSSVIDVEARPGFDDNYFNSIADSYIKYQKPLFDEQVADTRRKLPLQFSNTANSEYLRTLGEFERDVAREEANLRNKALDFANQQRGEVERNRADLINMANAGTDASVLASQATSRAAALSKPPSFSPIADLFQKYTAMGGNMAIAKQQQEYGGVESRPLLFSNNGTTAQRIIR